MSIERVDDIICIIGDAGAADAETLGALIAQTPNAAVDWASAGSLHTAVVQVLLIFRPVMIGMPIDAFVARWISPMLDLRR